VHGEDNKVLAVCVFLGPLRPEGVRSLAVDSAKCPERKEYNLTFVLGDRGWFAVDPFLGFFFVLLILWHWCFLYVYCLLQFLVYALEDLRPLACIATK
jgi:hypothetical protein